MESTTRNYVTKEELFEGIDQRDVTISIDSHNLWLDTTMSVTIFDGEIGGRDTALTINWDEISSIVETVDTLEDQISYMLTFTDGTTIWIATV